MIVIGESGVSCGECYYSEAVKTKQDEATLSARLKWVNGDPVCPECGNRARFESYIEDEK